jgi:hypothetical protein
MTGLEWRRLDSVSLLVVCGQQTPEVVLQVPVLLPTVKVPILVPALLQLLAVAAVSLRVGPLVWE